ncbi:hypothetical protein MMC11_006058 [Xylographa trunciseda]|nr:hypothetical protein [Xylographa trunciseda]
MGGMSPNMLGSRCMQCKANLPPSSPILCGKVPSASAQLLRPYCAFTAVLNYNQSASTLAIHHQYPDPSLPSLSSQPPTPPSPPLPTSPKEQNKPNQTKTRKLTGIICTFSKSHTSAAYTSSFSRASTSSADPATASMTLPLIGGGVDAAWDSSIAPSRAVSERAKQQPRALGTSETVMEGGE